MKTRPIIFSAPMVLALLGGRKTQTRRLVKGAPEGGDWHCDRRSDGWWFVASPGAPSFPAVLRFAVGDFLWVRETWQTGSNFDGPKITFRATPDYFDIDAWDGEDYGAGPSFNYDKCPGATWGTWIPDLLAGRDGSWRSPLHMPRWASRITLEVTAVKIERLQDISEEDAIAEGVYTGKDGDLGPLDISARALFADLWKSIHGPDSAKANPFVVATTFKVHKRNVDDLASQEAKAA